MNEGGTLVVVNSTIADNSAVSGGGLYSVSGTTTVTDSTVGDNAGGGISDVAGSDTLDGTIVAGSTGNPDLSALSGGTFAGANDLPLVGIFAVYPASSPLCQLNPRVPNSDAEPRR